jgi:hypothetical protein
VRPVSTNSNEVFLAAIDQTFTYPAFGLTHKIERVAAESHGLNHLRDLGRNECCIRRGNAGSKAGQSLGWPVTRREIVPISSHSLRASNLIVHCMTHPLLRSCPASVTLPWPARVFPLSCSLAPDNWTAVGGLGGDAEDFAVITRKVGMPAERTSARPSGVDDVGVGDADVEARQADIVEVVSRDQSDRRHP